MCDPVTAGLVIGGSLAAKTVYDAGKARGASGAGGGSSGPDAAEQATAAANAARAAEQRRRRQQQNLLAMASPEEEAEKLGGPGGGTMAARNYLLARGQIAASQSRPVVGLGAGATPATSTQVRTPRLRTRAVAA